MKRLRAHSLFFAGCLFVGSLTAAPLTPADVAALQAVVQDAGKPAEGRTAALWTLQNLGQAKEPLLAVLLQEKSEALLKNTLRVVALQTNLPAGSPVTAGVIRQLQNPDAAVRKEAILACAALAPDPGWEKALVAIYPQLQDAWSKSALLSITAGQPGSFLPVAAAADQNNLEELIGLLATQVAAKNDPALVGETLVQLATQHEKAKRWEQLVLEKLGRELSPQLNVPWTPELKKFFAEALTAADLKLAATALPLARRWDTQQTLTTEVKGLTAQLLAVCADETKPEPLRLLAAESLMELRTTSPEVVPAVAKMLGGKTSPGLQKQIIETWGRVADSAMAQQWIALYPQLPDEAKAAAYNQLLKRPESALALLDAIRAKKISLTTFSPMEVDRLRTHSDAKVADLAAKVIAEIRGPEMKEKDALVAKYAPDVEKAGNAENGKKLFTQNCAVCHRFNGEGRDLAPDLTGMGVHGPAELLVHVLDPNRVVEPNFVAVSVETKDDQSLDGIVARENKATLLLRNAAGDVEIKKENIQTRRSTGRSLMPEGFEALGGEALRDILTYVCGTASPYRIIDLRKQATATTARGLYASQDALTDTLPFKKFGIVKVGDVPFEILNPDTADKNVIVLKGGSGFAKSRTMGVELANINIPAHRLHFLATAGWGWPFGGEANKDLPVSKATLFYQDGRAEQFVFTNGVEFVDYLSNADVPGSKSAAELLERGQVRTFARDLHGTAPIDKIILESLDNAVAPTYVALTVETGLPNIPVPSTNFAGPVNKIEDLAAFYPKILGNFRVFMLGGGSSHDFDKYFNVPDSVTLSYASEAPINYTEKLDYFEKGIKDSDILYLCSNQPMTNDAVNKAIFDFADKGGGLLLIHPALWYNWKNWPEYNRVMVGGGTRKHDVYGEIEVTITNRKHPIMKLIPPTFRVNDELYHFQPDKDGTPIEVLATGKNLKTGNEFPVIWITKHPKARIFCVTLGHDASTHDNIAYRVMLQYAMAWVGKKL